MAKLRKPFFLALAMTGVSVRRDMMLLVEQTESVIAHTLSEIVGDSNVIVEQVSDCAEDGSEIMVDLYSYKGLSGYDECDVKEDYGLLIEQLSRRSTFLTLFGLFEYHLEACGRLMAGMSGYSPPFDEMKNGTVEKTHRLLKHILADEKKSKSSNIEHLLIIRNLLAHNNGMILNDRRKCLVRALRRIENDKGGVSSNTLSIQLNAPFLPYVVSEFRRYHEQMESAIHSFYLKKSPSQD
ncbi:MULTISPECIES: hypothetical protein [unclassified Pantoea]|nr:MULTISPECIES: hypothetical protein [unclassified Pantoea]KAA6093785.1 hypothetical protein F3I21_22730 [Pantoea sp. B_9]KAA6106146.1 hypothetical protein F3I18_23920 [Pantoea sp. B_10]